MIINSVFQNPVTDLYKSVMPAKKFSNTCDSVAFCGLFQKKSFISKYKVEKKPLEYGKTILFPSNTKMVNVNEDAHIDINGVQFRLSEFFSDYEDGEYSIGSSEDDTMHIGEKYISDSRINVVKEKGKYYINKSGNSDRTLVTSLDPSIIEPCYSLDDIPDSRICRDVSFNFLNKYTTANNFKFNSPKQKFWDSHFSKPRQVCPWKMHVYAQSIPEWKMIANCVGNYLLENNISFKIASSKSHMAALNSSALQHGKAITIYPKNIEEFKKIALDIDYILRNNKLYISNTNISGDRKLGYSGRLFYRYGLNSGNAKDRTFDLKNSSQSSDYFSMYDSNRSGDKYLASDMNLSDDPFLTFNPSNEPRIIRPIKPPVGQKFNINNCDEWVEIGNDADIYIGSEKVNLRNSFEQSSNGSYYIGRKLDNDIILNDCHASRHHAIVLKYNNQYYIKDLNSVNGTLVVPR